MWKQWLIALVLVAVAIGGAFVYLNLARTAMRSPERS